MQQRHASTGNAMDSPIAIHLGAHLRLLRDRHGLSQIEILKHLPGWQQAAYSRIEKATRAPLFENLPQIWHALKAAGVRPTVQDRESFLLLAQELLESRKTRHAHRSSQEWSALRAQLASIDGLPLTSDISLRVRRPSQQKHSVTPRREIGHLLGREQWLAEVTDMIAGLKVLIIQGPPGCGKTSELHRLLSSFSRQSTFQVVLSEPAPIQLGRIEAADILEQVLGDVLDVVGTACTALPTVNLEVRVKYVLDLLAKVDRRVLIFLDNAEHIFDQGNVGAVWRRFLTQFLQGSHQATLVLASQEWPTGSYLEESQLVRTTSVPRLSRYEGSQLLQTLGVWNVSEEVLGRAVDVVGGIPLCLEWIVRLIREPLLRDEWSDFDEGGKEQTILERLLQDPALFGGAVAKRVQPLLDRVIARLSEEAVTALQELAKAPVPLGAPALRALYQSPKPLRELREASLLVSYPQRIQLLPMVAAQVQQGLSHDQMRSAEERLVGALLHWLKTSLTLDHREMGSLITTIAEIYLKHHRFLDAAQFVIRHGWLSFRLGHARRLAQLALKGIEEVHQQVAEPLDIAQRCGGILLFYFLAPFAEHVLDAKQRMSEYQFVLHAAMNGTITLEPVTEIYLTRTLVAYTLSQLDKMHIEEAGSLFSMCRERMSSHVSTDPDLQAALYEVEAHLLTRQSDFAEDQGTKDQAIAYRNQAIQVYQEACALLSNTDQFPALTSSLWKKRLAKITTSLGYHLDQLGHCEDALDVIEQSIQLKEAGFVEPGTLASSYGEKSQALAALGRFEEALHFDTLAVEEVERMARAGDTLAQAERWVYLVNRAYLYLLLQRVDEAEHILREASPYIAETRRKYSLLADQTLKEIEAWRKNSSSSHYQRDWRWLGRLREAASYNAFWWLAHAGPFSTRELQVWETLVAHPADEARQKQLETILRESRQRELEQALAKQQVPHLWYPAIPIEEVRARIDQLAQLDEDIAREEPNEIIRQLYREKIEEEIAFLRLIEAAHTQDREQFWAMNHLLHPAPTQEEMQYALDHVYALIGQGLRHERSREAAEKLTILFQTHLRLSFQPQKPETYPDMFTSLAPASGPHRFLSAQAAQRFFATVLREGGAANWNVILDAAAAGVRVEAASHLLILPDRRLSLDECKTWYEHEVLGHIADSVAGERSPLGLLALGTRNYLPVLEGLALYREMQMAKASGKAFDDSRIWLGTLSTGLAAGVGVPAQSFLHLYTTLKTFLILFRLLRRPDEDRETVERSAGNLAQTFCLRVFRGVSDLEQPGVYYSKDTCYLRGYLCIQQEVAKDPSLLNRLAIGRTAIEYLPALARLGINPTLQPLQKLAQGTDLDAYLLSFENSLGAEEGSEALDTREQC